MTAQEFIKQYGWSEAKRILHDARGCASVRLYDKYEFSTDDLKQLVDAWELVQSYGGLQQSKDHLNHRREYGLYQLPKLIKAIHLVEQIGVKP